MINPISLLCKFKAYPLRTLTNTLTYLRQGLVLVQLFLTLFNTALLLKIGAISTLPIYILVILVISLILPPIIILGYYDFKKGTYQSSSVISTKNSPPARDTYKFFTVMMQNLIQKEIIENSEENQKLLESMKRWYK
jgi:hypothetical protein